MIAPKVAAAFGVAARTVRERSDRLGEGEQLHVDLLGRAVPVVRTPDGLWAVNKGKPGNPDRIEKYLRRSSSGCGSTTSPGGYGRSWRAATRRAS